MKKTFLLFILAVSISLVSFSQKIYKTNSAQIKFQPVSEEGGCINNQVLSLLNSSSGQIGFSALVKGFKFNNSLLEDHFNENYMESTKYPNASFKGSVVNIKDVDFNKNGTYNVTVTGNLTIHGVTKPINTKGSIEISEGKIIAKSNFKVGVKDYGITGNYIGGKINAIIDVSIISVYE